MKLRAVAVEVEEDDVRGINTKAQLAEAEAVAQQRLRKAALDAGVTLVAPETVFLCGRHQIRQGRRGRALCGVRRQGDGRGRRRDPLVLASRRRPCRQGRVGRAVCAAAARARSSATASHIGNFVEVKEAVIEAGAKANHLSLYRRRLRRRRRQYRRRHHHLQLRRRAPSTAPRSARAPSSARTRRWWRRSRSATAPMSARAR